MATANNVARKDADAEPLHPFLDVLESLFPLELFSLSDIDVSSLPGSSLTTYDVPFIDLTVNFES